MPSASTYGAYVNTNIIPNSNDGCFRKSMCFSSKALISANTMPIPADAKNIVKNVLNAEAIASPVSESGIRDTVVVSTIAMASRKKSFNFDYFLCFNGMFLVFFGSKMTGIFNSV